LRGPAPTKKTSASRPKVKAKKKTVAAKKTVRKLTKKQMQCKHPSGCEERSLGPRWHFLCRGHQPKAGRPNLRVVKAPPSDKAKGKIARAA
jgi:hypothetical protein